jgi:hypothetical protein
MKGKSVNSRNSGQALIITSLIIAMLLLSTVYYVFEIKRSATKNQTTINSTIIATKLGAVNTVISALANFSSGGDREVLTANLNKLSSTLRNHSYDSKCDLQFAPLNISPYEDGMWISWGYNGSGVSSAFVTFLINFSGPSATCNSEYETNITTTLTLEGVYTSNGTEKSVNLTCRMYNEKEPALANDITVFYQNEPDGSWTIVDPSNNLNMIDYGNGTYFMSFDAHVQNILQVSASAHDLRDICVAANATCTEI